MRIVRRLSRRCLPICILDAFAWMVMSLMYIVIPLHCDDETQVLAPRVEGILSFSHVKVLGKESAEGKSPLNHT